MKKALLVAGLLLVGCILLAYHQTANQNVALIEEKSSAPLTHTDSPHARDSSCPIKKIHPGMSLPDVRTQLAGAVMDYRGTRQDADVYFVVAESCHAFLDFNSQNGGLDAIDYGLGFDKIEFRKNAPSQRGQAASQQVTSGTTSPEPSKGFPVPEQTFVNTYVLANLGHGDLDKDQLEQLAHDEYEMASDMDTRSLLLMDGVVNTRAKRAMDYLDVLATT